MALDRRTERQYEAQRQVGESVADAVLDSFDVTRKERIPEPGAGAQFRGPPKA